MEVRVSGDFKIRHGIFWGLIFGPGIFGGFDFWPHLVPVT